MGDSWTQRLIRGYWDAHSKWDYPKLGANRGCKVNGCDGQRCGLWLLDGPRFNNACVQVKIHNWIGSQPGNSFPRKTKKATIARLVRGECLFCGDPSPGDIWHYRCRQYQKAAYRDHLEELLLIQRYLCSICGCGIYPGKSRVVEGVRWESAHVDHIVPVGKKMNQGSVMDICNLQATCGPCNLKKGGTMPDCEIMGPPGHQYPAYNHYRKENTR